MVVGECRGLSDGLQSLVGAMRRSPAALGQRHGNSVIDQAVVIGQRADDPDDHQPEQASDHDTPLHLRLSPYGVIGYRGSTW